MWQRVLKAKARQGKNKRIQMLSKKCGEKRKKRKEKENQPTEQNRTEQSDECGGEEASGQARPSQASFKPSWIRAGQDSPVPK